MWNYQFPTWTQRPPLTQKLIRDLKIGISSTRREGWRNIKKGQEVFYLLIESDVIISIAVLQFERLSNESDIKFWRGGNSPITQRNSLLTASTSKSSNVSSDTRTVRKKVELFAITRTSRFKGLGIWYETRPSRGTRVNSTSGIKYLCLVRDFPLRGARAERP